MTYFKFYILTSERLISVFTGSSVTCQSLYNFEFKIEQFFFLYDIWTKCIYLDQMYIFAFYPTCNN